jgi:hypothetical protein
MEVEYSEDPERPVKSRGGIHLQLPKVTDLDVLSRGSLYNYYSLMVDTWHFSNAGCIR